MNRPDALQTAFRARSEILWETSLELRALDEVELLAGDFEQSVRGFHLVEKMPDGTCIRWMTRRAEFRLRTLCSKLTFEVRSLGEGNLLAFIVNGRTLAEFTVGLDWMSGVIDLTPFAGACLKFQIVASQSFSAPGDDRELAVLFRKLESQPRKSRLDVAGSHSRSSSSSLLRWVRPELPVLPGLGAGSASVCDVKERERPCSSALLAVKFSALVMP